MYDLKLPATTAFNKQIPMEKLFLFAVTGQAQQEIYKQQIDHVTWCNKLSSETIDIKCSNSFSELEVFEIGLKEHSLDKRILRQIDKGIPYYIFHVVCHDEMYQAWIANKRNYNGKIKVENYLRTNWHKDTDFTFSFKAPTIDKVYDTLCEQIMHKRRSKLKNTDRVKECSAFMSYFRTMKMTRSYKPVLILALLQEGGSITVEQAASYFVKFYQKRKDAGLKPEVGNCIYADEPENKKAINYNLIHNPIDALCHSNFFEYNAKEKVLTFSDEIYDGLTLDDIDEIGKVCDLRLRDYYKNIG